MEDSTAPKNEVLVEADLKINILVVDDDLMVLEVLVDYLKSFGFQNVTALHDSKKVLKNVQDPNLNYDLILSDWEMPGVSGLTLLQAVRKNDLRINTKFIIVTSQQSMERFKISRAAHWQVNAYIVKPFRSSVLKNKIWQVMGWAPSEEKRSGEKQSDEE